MTELAVFGSVLRAVFRPDSDIDLLVQFAAEHHLSFDDYVMMKDELAALFGREVDLVMRKALEESYN